MVFICSIVLYWWTLTDWSLLRYPGSWKDSEEEGSGVASIKSDCLFTSWISLIYLTTAIFLLILEHVSAYEGYGSLTNMLHIQLSKIKAAGQPRPPAPRIDKTWVMVLLPQALATCSRAVLQCSNTQCWLYIRNSTRPILAVSTCWWWLHCLQCTRM